MHKTLLVVPTQQKLLIPTWSIRTDILKLAYNQGTGDYIFFVELNALATRFFMLFFI